MKPQLSHRDYEQISVYLDGGLTPKERAFLEARLQGEHDFKDAFQKIQYTRLLLKRLPKVKAPRNFTLTPAMVGKSATHSAFVPHSFNTLRLSAVLSSVLLVFVLLGDLLSNGLRPTFVAMAPAPAQVQQLALPAAATNGVGVLKEASPGEEGNAVMATSVPMTAAAADMVAANLQATQPLPTQAAPQAAQPAGLATGAAQSKESAPTATFVTMPTTALLAALPNESQVVETASPTVAETPASPSSAGEQVTPASGLQQGIPPARTEQFFGVNILWRVAEAFLLLVLLVTGISAWWVRLKFRK